jgi:predicted nucleotidyltransferase
MQPIVANKLPEVAELCRRFHVRRLELFGSAATADFDPERSDIDTSALRASTGRD